MAETFQQAPSEQTFRWILNNQVASQIVPLTSQDFYITIRITTSPSYNTIKQNFLFDGDTYNFEFASFNLLLYNFLHFPNWVEAQFALIWWNCSIEQELTWTTIFPNHCWEKMQQRTGICETDPCRRELSIRMLLKKAEDN